MAFRRPWRGSRFFWTLSDNAVLDWSEFRSNQATLIAWTVAATIAKAAATNGPHLDILAESFDLLLSSYLSDSVIVLPDIGC